MTIKYKVVDPRVRFIADIPSLNAMRGGGSKPACELYSDQLNASFGEFLDEDSAEQEKFEMSLRKGLLRKFIDNGLIEVVDVKEETAKGLDAILKNNPFIKRKDIEPSKEVDVVTVGNDWNKMTHAEKRALLDAEDEQIAKKKAEEEALIAVEKAEITAKQEAETKSEAALTIELFNKLKYQDKLKAIAKCEDQALLTVIANSEKQGSMLYNRASTRISKLSTTR